MSDDGAVVFVIDDDESMRRSLATLLGHAQDAGEIDLGKLRCVRIASPRSAPCGATVFGIFCYGSLTFR